MERHAGLTEYVRGGISLKEQLEGLNALSERFGLSLTPRQLQELRDGRDRALEETGRVEFGEGVLPKLVYAFCDSPFIQRGEYAQTLLALQNLFYALKRECADRLTDDELIAFMESAYNGGAQGSLDVLEAASPEEIFRWVMEGGRG